MSQLFRSMDLIRFSGHQPNGDNVAEEVSYGKSYPTYVQRRVQG